MTNFNFEPFASIVSNQINYMCDRKIDLVKIDAPDIFQTYLDAFPEGTNPVYKTNTYFDCSCCKGFVRTMGSVVHVDDEGNISTIWDKAIEKAEYPFNEVSRKMREYILEFDIENIFKSSEKFISQEYSYQMGEDGKTIRHNHFWATLTKKPVDNSKINVHKHDVVSLKTALEKFDGTKEILDLIEDENLFDGRKFEKIIKLFYKFQKNNKKNNFDMKVVWGILLNNYQLKGFKGSVMGTLLEELSKGISLDVAVRKYESMVAPHNYKRPKSLVTKGMIENAIKKIDELGVRTLLDRRLVRNNELPLQNCYWINSGSGKFEDPLAKLMEGDIKRSKNRKSKNSNGEKEQIPIEKFISEVVPIAKEIKLKVDSRIKNNGFVLTRGQNETAGLFYWDNDFAWSYVDGVADAGVLKDKVRSAGGQVDNCLLRVSLGWHNSDDLDIHIIDPFKNHIYFGNRIGFLDVDMNAGSNMNAIDPVENIRWTSNLKDGVYEVYVHNFSDRNPNNRKGFCLEVEDCHGNISVFESNSSPRQQRKIDCLNIYVINGEVKKIDSKIGNPVSGSFSKIWGIDNNQLISVKAIFNSPNCWNKSSRDFKHYFFSVDNLDFSDTIFRGFYNDFLKSELQEHRKFFEIIGGKYKLNMDDTQHVIKGFGFSNSRPSEFNVEVLTNTGKRELAVFV